MNPELSDEQLLQRLYEADPKNRLVITPWQNQRFVGGTIDLRLGTKFIVVQRTLYSHVNPLDLRAEEVPQLLQRINLRMGEEIALHPMSFVLAVTMEYLSLPLDIRASVLTRSSFGRLGLITATAVHVHPGWKGSLTLEMVNFGDSPIVVTPGLPVAQLVLEKVEPDKAFQPGRYALATEPQFPLIGEGREIAILRALRDKFRAGSGFSSPTP